MYVQWRQAKKRQFPVAALLWFSICTFTTIRLSRRRFIIIIIYTLWCLLYFRIRLTFLWWQGFRKDRFNVHNVRVTGHYNEQQQLYACFCFIYLHILKRLSVKYIACSFILDLAFVINGDAVWPQTINTRLLKKLSDEISLQMKCKHNLIITINTVLRMRIWRLSGYTRAP